MRSSDGSESSDARVPTATGSPSAAPAVEPPAEPAVEPPAEPTVERGAAAPPPLDYRPRKVLFVAIGVAALLVVVSAVVSARLRSYDTGVYFRVSDQVAIVCAGLLLACGALLFTRMRVRADEHGVRVQNIVATRTLPWDQVLRVSFPEGAPWGRLEIPDDEYVAVMAIQAADKHRAVVALRALRALHRHHAPYVAPHPAERGAP